MKYWTITFPGEFGQHVVETWTEEQIIASYYKYWSIKMIEAGHGDNISKEECIMDWIVVHWAAETDRWGNSLVGPKTGTL